MIMFRGSNIDINLVVVLCGLFTLLEICLRGKDCETRTDRKSVIHFLRRLLRRNASAHDVMNHEKKIERDIFASDNALCSI